MMKKNNKKAMYDMVKKMRIGGKNPIKKKNQKVSAEAQAAFNARKEAAEAAARQARMDAKVKGITDPEELKKIEMEARAKATTKSITGKGGMKVYKAGGAVKPDFLDFDGDGNTSEPMKEAAKGNNQANKGMKIKKAPGGMKVYNNGGKDENLPEGKMDPKEKANYGARKARRQAIKEARKEGRATAAKPGKKRIQKTLAQRGAEQKGDTSLFGPESLRRGRRRRLSRRLERSAEKAGISKDKAYSSEAALRTAAKAEDAGDIKKRDAALKTERLQRKYQGEKVVTTIGKKKNKRVEPARGTKKPRGGRSQGLLPTFTKKSGKGRQAAGRRRAINEAINKARTNRGKRRAERQSKRR